MLLTSLDFVYAVPYSRSTNLALSNGNIFSKSGGVVEGGLSSGLRGAETEEMTSSFSGFSDVEDILLLNRMIVVVMIATLMMKLSVLVSGNHAKEFA